MRSNKNGNTFLRAIVKNVKQKLKHVFVCLLFFFLFFLIKFEWTISKLPNIGFILLMNKINK